MRSHRRGLRALALAVAVTVPLGVAPAADAASSKRCKALAKKAKAKVIKKGKTSLVTRRGNEDNFTLTYTACLYSKPKLYKIPGQNGGDTEFYGQFKLAGRYVAYTHQNVEEAASEVPTFVELIDLRQRKRLHQFDAFPGGDASGGVTHLLLQPSGAIAWIGEGGDPLQYSVQSALPDQESPVEAARGSDVGKRSLRRVAGDANSFTYSKGGVRQTATFGGP